MSAPDQFKEGMVLVSAKTVISKVKSEYYDHFLVPVLKDKCNQLAFEDYYQCLKCSEWVKTNTGDIFLFMIFRMVYAESCVCFLSRCLVILEIILIPKVAHSVLYCLQVFSVDRVLIHFQIVQ